MERASKELAVKQLSLELVVDIGGEGDYRPEVIGNLADGNASFPKPSSYIDICDPEGKLKLEDRKLFNILLAFSWRALKDATPDAVFSCSCAELKRAIGQRTERGNHRLKASLQRLLETTVKFRKRMPDGSMGEAATHLISYAAVSDLHGMAEWDFHGSWRPYLKMPAQWARINQDTNARFHCKYALPLYEQLARREKLDFPVWTVGLTELRAYLSVAGDKYLFLSQLRQTVIEPALKEVNELARFEADYELIAGSGTQEDRIRFTVKPKREVPA